MVLSGIREENLNIMLAELLAEAGLQALGEAIVKKINSGRREPDIIIDLNGIILLIEGKYPGHREELKKQAIQRIDEGLCDIVVMVEYANLNISSMLLPSQKDIKEALRNGRFNVGFATFIERIGLEKWLDEEKKIITSQFYENIDFKDLLTYILTVYDYVVHEDVISPIVSKLEKSVLLFAEKMLQSGINIKRMKRALELE